MIAEVRNQDLDSIRASQHLDVQPRFFKRHSSIIVGVALSVLIHAMVFLFLMDGTPPFKKVQEIRMGDTDALTITLVSPSTTESSQKKLTPAPEVEVAKKLAPARKNVPRIAAQPATKPSPVTPPEITNTPPSVNVSPPVDDFSARLEENRKRRAEAQLMERDGAAEEELQRRNRAVLANVATSLERSNGTVENGHGGVFQVRNVGASSAEFLFRGWSSHLNRNSTQLIEVSKSGEPDIYIAIVKRMIQIIREEKHDDFVWESHRLGREITLSARPEFDAELRQFLLLEFFPSYVPGAR